MSEAYVKVTQGLDSAALGMRGEWFACTGDLKSAVEYMRRAMQAEPEGRNKQYKDRLAELEKEAAERAG